MRNKYRTTVRDKKYEFLESSRQTHSSPNIPVMEIYSELPIYKNILFMPIEKAREKSRKGRLNYSIRQYEGGLLNVWKSESSWPFVSRCYISN